MSDAENGSKFIGKNSEFYKRTAQSENPIPKPPIRPPEEDQAVDIYKSLDHEQQRDYLEKLQQAAEAKLASQETAKTLSDEELADISAFAGIKISDIRDTASLADLAAEMERFATPQKPTHVAVPADMDTVLTKLSSALGETEKFKAKKESTTGDEGKNRPESLTERLRHRTIVTSDVVSGAAASLPTLESSGQGSVQAEVQVTETAQDAKAHESEIADTLSEVPERVRERVRGIKAEYEHANDSTIYGMSEDEAHAKGNELVYQIRDLVEPLLHSPETEEEAFELIYAFIDHDKETDEVTRALATDAMLALSDIVRSAKIDSSEACKRLMKELADPESPLFKRFIQGLSTEQPINPLRREWTQTLRMKLRASDYSEQMRAVMANPQTIEAYNGILAIENPQPSDFTAQAKVVETWLTLATVPDLMEHMREPFSENKKAMLDSLATIPLNVIHYDGLDNYTKNIYLRQARELVTIIEAL